MGTYGGSEFPMTSRKPGMDSRGSRGNRMGFFLLGTREPGREKAGPGEEEETRVWLPQVRRPLENSPDSPEHTKKQAI